MEVYLTHPNMTKSRNQTLNAQRYCEPKKYIFSITDSSHSNSRIVLTNCGEYFCNTVLLMEPVSPPWSVAACPVPSCPRLLSERFFSGPAVAAITSWTTWLAVRVSPRAFSAESGPTLLRKSLQKHQSL